MEDYIVFYEVEKSAAARQGELPTGLPGYEIWHFYPHKEGMNQDFLEWITYDMYMVTRKFYNDKGYNVSVVRLGI